MTREAREAVVVRQDARGCRVRFADGEERWCAVRGRVHLRGADRTTTTTVAVGDRVLARTEGAGRGALEEILPRTSLLSRPDPHLVRRQHAIAANVDQVVVTTAAAEPGFTPGFVDRVLCVAEWSRLAALVVVNKMDLVEREPAECEAYRRMGYLVLPVSARRGDGVDGLRQALRGRTSVVTGHSGVGKSSLLNAVEPGLGLREGDVNVVTGRGRQTTTAAVLVALSTGGAVVDTPGLREFGLFNVPPREVTWLFRDLRAVAPRCRFADCLHRSEPGCAVPAAVAAGEVAAFRFDSYLRLLETAGDVASWEIHRG
jgi:ribosome biogenesis GTPase